MTATRPVQGGSPGTWGTELNAYLDALAASLPFNVKTYGALGDGSTDDTAAINLAIAALTAAGVGTLFFPAGRYQTSGGHSITVPCTISGEGQGTIGTGNGVSTVALKNSSNATMFALAAKNVTITDLGLYGNQANQTSTSHGITTSAATACNYFIFRNLWIDSFHDDGINFSSPGSSLQGVISGCTINLCQGRGITVGSGCADIHVTDTILSQNGLSGASINSADIVFTAVHSWGNGTLSTSADCSGVLMPSGAPGKCRFVNCYFESNGTSSASGRGAQPRGTGNAFQGCYFYNNRGNGAYVFSNTNTVFTGCVFDNNARNGASGANGAGVQFDTCTASSVVSCQFFDTGGTKKQTYGYAENSTTCTGCLFSGNVSRAADHLTGNWLIGAGATPTIPATPASYNVG